jgi:hypothetical protein
LGIKQAVEMARTVVDVLAALEDEAAARVAVARHLVGVRNMWGGSRRFVMIDKARKMALCLPVAYTPLYQLQLDVVDSVLSVTGIQASLFKAFSNFVSASCSRVSD